MSKQREDFTAAHPARAQYGTPAYQAWEDWLRVHGFPIQQVSVSGWVERDTDAQTVSALVYAWPPGDEENFRASKTTRSYLSRNHRGSIAYMWDSFTLTYLDGSDKDAWMGVLTIQLDHEPLPFPEVA